MATVGTSWPWIRWARVAAWLVFANIMVSSSSARADEPPFPPLSYSLPTYSQNGYDNIEAALDVLVDHGFRWVTLTPTWVVGRHSTIQQLVLPEIGSIQFAQTPTFETIQAVAEAAASRGLNVKFEPHLDWDTTFSGEAEDWRRRMYFDPNDSSFGYADQILEPIQGAIEAVASQHPNTQFALTLGSELDVSLYENAAGWQQVLEQLEGRRAMAGLDDREMFGTKMNHDTFPSNQEVFNELNRGRSDSGLDPITRNVFDTQRAAAVTSFLQELGYVSMSFYPLVQFRYPDGTIADDTFWDRTDPDGSIPQADVDAIAATLLDAANGLRGLLDAGGVNVAMDFGEFGLGNSDPNNSYLTDADSVRERNVMREKFLRGFLDFLRNAGHITQTDPDDLESALPATMWTAGPQYDVMEIFPGLDRAGLDDFRDVIRGYNDAFTVQADGTCSIAMVPDEGGDCRLPQSCLELYEHNGDLPDGNYQIDPDSDGLDWEPFTARCEMEDNGGGWTLTFAKKAINPIFDPIPEVFWLATVYDADSCWKNQSCLSQAFASVPATKDLMFDSSDAPIIEDIYLARTVVTDIHSGTAGMVVKEMMTGENLYVDLEDNSNVTNTFFDGASCGTWSEWGNAICSTDVIVMQDKTMLGACGYNYATIGLNASYSTTSTQCGGFPQNHYNKRFPVYMRMWVR